MQPDPDRPHPARPSRPGRREGVLLAVLTAALLAPFLGKAVHMDDPLFVWAARRITEAPFDFYGVQVNWYGASQPLHEVAQNPPLVSYLLALGGSLTGWSEIGLHATLLLPSVLAALGVHRLARRFTSRPLLAALAVVLTPVFAVSATTLMCDVTMLAFLVWSLALWIEGAEDGRAGKLGAAALLAGGAALSKYVGVGAIGLLAVWSLLHRRPRTLAWLALPVAAVVLYDLWTRQMYGRALFSAAARYVGMAHGVVGQGPHLKAAVAVAFLGGCLPWAVFRSARILAVCAALGALVVVFLILSGSSATGLYWLSGDQGVRWPIAVQVAVLATAGFCALAIAIEAVRARRDAATVTLALWTAGGFLFAFYLNWSVSARSLLLVAPPLAILYARSLEGRPKLAWPIAVSALVSLPVVLADVSLAGAGRDAAREVVRRHASGLGQLYFQGHWGFQYYCEPLGAKALDLDRFRLDPGDIVVMPRNATNTNDLPEPAWRLVEKLTFPTLPWISTQHLWRGAGFYSAAFGPLPYSFGPVPPEEYDVWRIVVPIAAGR